ncbi:hypothetical protein TNCT_603101 [Trichonephila clavata]|uniref:Uncharacterized protein n=1 Tax=Trichonephila clavata TaxID=2740835 RepID=A0A8X6F2A2_TRICU|nr:hypothetical protein TNCT_603101 [Trichonephila clavata]
MLPLPGQPPRQLLRMPPKSPEQTSTSSKSQFLGRKGKDKKRNARSSQKQSHPSSSSHKSAEESNRRDVLVTPTPDQFIDKPVTNEIRSPTSSDDALETTNQNPGDTLVLRNVPLNRTEATKTRENQEDDPTSLLDTLSQINDPEVQEMIAIVEKFIKISKSNKPTAHKAMELFSLLKIKI